MDDKAEICKEFLDGRVLLNFNPPNKCPDSEDVGEGWVAEHPERGTNSIDRARMRAEAQIARTSTLYDYHTSVPCIFCTNCIIVRGYREGTLCNVAYFCRELRRKVEKCGTCRMGVATKNGPMIIRQDVTVAEALEVAKTGKLNN